MTSILIVDDNSVDRELASGLLSGIADVQIETAANGTDATLRINMSPPDLVITDLQMPEMNGLELVQWMQEQFPEIPVVLMTSQGSEQIAIDALNHGASSYVPKSSLSQTLVDTIEQILVQRQVEMGYDQLMSCQKRMHFTYELENDLQSLHALIEMIQRILAGMKFCSHAECAQTGIALREALMNALFRGNLELTFQQTAAKQQPNEATARMQQAPYKDRKIFVEGTILPEQIEITIRDEGSGFDVATELQRANDVQANIASNQSGRGMILMQIFSDELNYNDTGNEVTIVKKKVFDLE